MGRKKWEANRSKKRWHLEWDGKNGKQRTPRKNGHLTKMDWEKKWEAHRSKKKGGILNRTEKMGSKELQETTVI